ncbi:MAG: membrane protein insertase YidC, partial [Myxococcales bacterium]
MKDSNQRLLLTVVLCMAVALVWSLVFQPKQQQRPSAQQTSPQPAQPPGAAAPAPSAPASGSAAAPASGGPHATSAPRPPARTVALDSEKLHVVVTSEGAALRSVQLKGDKFQRRKRGSSELTQVDLVDPQPGVPLPLSTVLRDGGGADLVPADAAYEVVRHDGHSAVFRTAVGGVSVTKTMTLDPQLYRVDLSVELRSDAVFSGQLVALSTGHGEAPSGGFFTGHTNAPARPICKAGGKLERLSVGDKHSAWDGPGPAAFAGIDEQYFIRAAVPPQGSPASCHIEAKPDGALLATLAVPVSVPAGGAASEPFVVYAGPKDTDELGAVAPVLKDSVDLG